MKKSALLLAALLLAAGTSARAGCGTTVNVKQAGGGDYTTIAAAVAGVPALGADYCINIDSAAYSEQVTIQGLTTNGFRLKIQSDPGMVSTAATVNPPVGSTAAFWVLNSSVSIVNLNIITTNTVAYGVFASSGFVEFDSLSIDSNGSIWKSGVSLSSFNILSNSSITVQDARGIVVTTGAIGAMIAGSTATSNSANYALLSLDPQSSSNTITGSFLSNPNSFAADISGVANKIVFSTLTTNNVSLGNGAILFGGAMNTVSDSVLQNISGRVVRVIPGGGGNSLIRSVATNSNNTFPSLEFDSGASSFTVSSCTLVNNIGYAVYMSPGSHDNTISQSTMNANNAGGGAALWIDGSATNTVTGSYVYNALGHAALITNNAYLNTITQSTMTTGNSAFVGLFFNFASASNTVTNSFIRNTDGAAGGNAVRIAANSNFNAISQSTIVAASASLGQGYRVLSSSANSLSFSYVSGSTAVFVGQSTNTSVNMSQLVAVSATGDVLHATNNNGLSIASTTLNSSAGGRGLILETGNSGLFALSTITISGASVGMNIANQGNITPGGSSITFRSLAAGATAINFTANTPVVTTFTLTTFEDASIAVNVNAVSLAAGARITMRQARGLRRGAAYENDPGNFVDWILPAFCVDGFTVAQAGGSDFTTIQAAVDALPSTLSGPACVVIQDGANYNEQVYVRNFNNAGSTITIMADPSSGLRPTVSPPLLSTAAFNIANASVNIKGLDIAVSANVPYGIFASSGYVNVSSVSVSTGGLQSIYSAGVSLSTWSTISYSTITVGATVGVRLADPIGHNTIAFSTVIATGGSFGAVAIDVVGGDSNTITSSYMQSLAGRGVYFQGGADYNTLTLSTITSNSTWQAVYIVNSASNTVSNSLIRNAFGMGLMMDTLSRYNKVAASSFTANDIAAYCLYINNSDSNTVSGSYLQNDAGPAIHISGGSDWNTLSFSTAVTGFGSGTSVMFVTSSDSNTVSDSYLQSAGNSSLSIQTNSKFNTVVLSTIVGGGGVGNGALTINNSEWNRVSSATLKSTTGLAVRMLSGADNNTISSSTLFSASWTALQIQNSSRNVVTNSFLTSPGAHALVLPGGGNLNSIFFSTVIAGGGVNRALFVSDGDSNTVTSSYLQSASGDAAWLEINSDGNMISFSTMVSGGTSMDALYIGDSASNTVTSCVMLAPAGNSALITSNSHHNTITSSSMTAGGTAGALYIFGSSNNTVTMSWMSNPASRGVQIQNGGGNTISFSTMSSASGGGSGLYIINSNTNTITSSVITNPFGHAAEFNTAHLNTIAASSVTAFSGGGNNALYINGSDSNTVTASYLENLLGRGIDIGAFSEANIVSFSTIVTNSGAYPALHLQSASLNTINGVVVRNPAGGAIALQTASNQNTITLSTAISGGGSGTHGLYIQASSSNTVFGSYIQGSTTAIYITGTSGNVVSSNRIVGVNANANGLGLASSVNFFMSSNVISAGNAAAGVNIEASNSGVILISTNIFLPGMQTGLFIGNPSGNTPIWITSNTFLPLPSAVRDTYGIYLNALTSGATIQNNGIYFRTPGGTAGNMAHAIFLSNASGVLIDHNRISNPGMVTGGRFTGVVFTGGGSNSTFAFNDVQSSGTGLTNAYLVRVLGASNTRIVNNVFSSSFVVSGSSASLEVAAGGMPGFVSDYNAFFSFNEGGYNLGIWGVTQCRLATGWTGAGCPAQDLSSLATDPMWFNPGAGIEDFHPRSSVGRYTPSGFVTTDADISSTIDRGDPNAPVGAEPSPNGALANQGSYGQTPEASKTLEPCPVVKTVKQSGGGDSMTIQGAVNALGGTLSGYSCVIIKDTATYNEQVTVANIAPGVSSMTIMGASFLSVRPTVSPNSGGQTAAFWIMNSSVNLRNLVVTPRANPIPYGILSSSDSVTISNVNVNDAEGRIVTAALSIATQTTVFFTSVTWGGGSGNGLNITGANNLISFSTFIVAGAASHATVLAGASTNTISDSFLQSSSGNTVFIATNSIGNTITRSTITRQAGAFGGYGLKIVGASSNTVTRSYISNDNDHAALIEGGLAGYNQITLSTMTAFSANKAALMLFASSWTTVSDSKMMNTNGGVGGPGLWLQNGAGYNAVLRSTMTNNSTAGGALRLDPGVSSNTFTQVYAYNANNDAASFDRADINIVDLSTFTSGGGGAGSRALYLNGASSNTFTRSQFISNASKAVYFDNAASSNTISFSSVTSNGAFPALDLFFGSSNTITNSFIYNMSDYALNLAVSAASNTISQSTITSAGGGLYTLLFNGASRNRIEQSYIQKTGGDAVRFTATSNFNTITLSTLTTASGPNFALRMITASTNTISRSVIFNRLGIAAYVGGASNFNVFTGNSITAPTNSALLLDSASSNTITQSFLSGPQTLTVTNSANGNTVSFSTVTDGSGLYALYMDRSSSNTLSNSYFEDVRAMYVSGSTGTVIADSTIVGSIGYGIRMQNGVVNTTVVRSTVVGNGGDAAIRIDSTGVGFTDVSSNTLRGVVSQVLYIAGADAGSTVKVASNTILPYVTVANGTYGLYLSNLPSGATVQNNNIYYRTSGSMGLFSSTAAYFSGVSGLVFDHNRVSNPGMITAGGYTGIGLDNGSTNATIKFNDVHSTGTTLSTGFLLKIISASTGFQIRNNIFSSSMSATTTSSATLAIDAGSLVGNPTSDYNDFFSSNAFNTGDTSAGYARFLAGWQAQTSQDLNSIAAHPRWADPGAGVEDFHPRSQEGRYTPGGFVNDAETSATIDGADPADAYGQEAGPFNGQRANLGSYGNTPEASKTFTLPLVLTGPANGAFISTSAPSFTWSGSYPPAFHFRLATDAALTAAVIDTDTSKSYFVSTNTLASNATYWWKVTNVGAAGASAVYSFVIDTASPTYSGVLVSTSPTGTFVSTETYLSTGVVTARITVQDPIAGLNVSTGLPAGLVGQWHFNESSGAVTIDASPINAHGLLSGGAGWTDGRRGGALDLSFNGSYAQVPHNGALNSSDLTIELWVKPTLASLALTGGDPFMPWVAKRTANATTPYVFGMRSGGKLSLNWWGSTGGFPSPTTPSILKLNEWQHIAVTRSGSAGAHLVTFYYNGAPFYSTTETDAGNVRLDSTQDLLLGMDAYFQTQTAEGTFRGALDDVRVFNIARSSAQILADYESDTLAAHARSKAYSVLYSTTSGLSWNYVSTNSVTLSGVNGTTGAQILQASSIPFTTSLTTGTNQLQFVASDMAGNVSTVTYRVLVDTVTTTPTGCVTVVNVRKSGVNAATSITAALAALPPVFTDPTCVVIRDTQTYTENVTVAGFDNAGWPLSIMADPVLTGRPVVRSVVAPATFDIRTATVSLLGIDIRPGVAAQYGIVASSAYVTISSVNIQDAAGFISGLGASGISISSWSTISYTSITVVDAAALTLAQATMTVVSYSTAMNNSSAANKYAAYLDGASSNTFTVFVASNSGGPSFVFENGAHDNVVSFSTITGVTAGSSALSLLTGVASNTVTNSVIFNPAGQAAFFGLVASYNTIAFSSVNSNSGGGYALWMNGATANTVKNSFVLTYGGIPIGLQSGANLNTIAFTTAVTNTAGVRALWLIGSDSNTITGSYFQNALGRAVSIESGSDCNTIAQSTVIANISGGDAGIHINDSDKNVLTGVFSRNAGGGAIDIIGGSDATTIFQSTAVTSAAGYDALLINGSSSSTITGSYLADSAGSGLRLVNASRTSISQSTMAGSQFGGAGLYIIGGGSNTVSGSFIRNAVGSGVWITNNSSSNTITASTMIALGANSYGYVVDQSSANGVSGSYIQGSTAVYIYGSSNTVIGSNVIVATNTAGSGVTLAGGSRNLSLSTNSISAATDGVGVLIDRNNTGVVLITSNTVLPGPKFGIQVTSQVPGGTSVWIATNTVLPLQSSVVDSYGIFLDGLVSGATVTNNAIYYRTSAGTGLRDAYGIFVLNSAGIAIDHNRINQPGVITGGTWGGVVVQGTHNGIFKFNDVHGVGSFANGALLVLSGMGNSEGWIVKNNVFMSSFSAPTSSTATIFFANLTGLQSDYNDFFSSNPVLTIAVGPAVYSLLPTLRSFGQDNNSYSAHPLWSDTTPGSENFHPLSQAGRFPGFAADSNSSPTIDAADPGDSVGAESAPNGGVANQGSYGQTAEASRSPAAPGAPLIAAVGVTSVTVSFTPSGADAYVVQAAVLANFTGTVISSFGAAGATAPLAPQGLTANTTYYLRAGAVWGGLTQYANAVPASTSTLTGAPGAAAPALTAISTYSITFNWLSGGNPVGTRYEMVASTAANFTGATTSSFTYNFFASTAGLAANTTYYFAAYAVNNNGVRSAGLFASTATLAGPAGLTTGATTFTSISARSITLNWSSGTVLGGYNPVGTLYDGMVSSDNFVTVSQSSRTANLYAQFTGLVPNTTYYTKVVALNHGSLLTAPLALGTTNTVAARPNMYLLQPDPVAGKDTSYGEFTDTSGLPNDPALKFGGFGEFHHGYIEFDLTGAPSAAQALSADLKLVRTATTGDDPALDLYRVTSAWTEAGINSIIQPSETPDKSFGPVVSGVNTNDITAMYRTWQTTTNNGLKLNSTVNSPDSSGSFASSDHPDATLRPRLEVVYSNNNFAFLTNTSIIVQWSSGSVTAGYNPTPTGYQVQASTDNFVTLVNTVGTYSLSNTFAGLTPNTTFQMRVRAFSGQGEPTDYSSLGSTATLASAPVTVVSTYSAVEIASFTVSWSRNNNPLSVTSYTVVFSTDPFPNSDTGNLFFTTAPAAGPSYTVNGLAAFTTYYVAIAAVNHNGVSTAYTLLGATRTLPISFAPPTFASYPGVFNSSITASWALVAGATGYTVLASTEALNPPVTVWASTTVLGGATTAGTPDSAALAANTTYFFFVRVNGAGASSAYASFPSTSTLASVPVFMPFQSITAASIVSTWTTGAPANPNGTLYELQMSTAPNFTGALTSSVTLNVSVSSAGLAANTTYFFQARAINNNNVPSAFGGTASTATLAAPPATAVTTFPVVGQTSMTVTWLSGGNPLNVTTYTVVLSTEAFYPNGATGNAVIAATAPAGSPLSATFGTGSLNPDTTYYLYIAAISHANIATSYTFVGSTKTLFSVLFPAIIDNQGGDNAFRTAAGGALAVYNIDFADSSGFQLTKFQIKASTSPNGSGSDLIPYTDVITSIGADSYTADWSLPAGFFTALYEGVTNYITVKAFNGLGNSTTAQDAFYILKDTTAPTLVNGQIGTDATVRSAAGTLYNVDAIDTASRLSNFQYSASQLKLSGDAAVIPWTDIAVVTNSSDATADWAVNFAALGSGPTNYISVRVWDQAGTTTTIVDAFYILKDTIGPTVGITVPGGNFISALSVISGTAASYYPLKGTEVSIQQAPPGGAYWNGGSFGSGTPMYFPATGGTSWTYAPGITYTPGIVYQVVARSSNTANLYSSTYATATFTFDSSTPTVGVALPVPNSTIASLPLISGTAADPAFNSGLSSIEVRLRRNADGLWWNWFTETWSGVQVSSVVGTASPWTLAPSAVLQANLDDGASYFIAVRASDNATPPNSGDFLLQGATFTFTDTMAPAGSTVTAVAGTSAGQIDLSWKATGDDDNTGTILLGEYRIWYSTDSGDAFSTTTAQIAFSTAMVVPGTTHSYTISSLTPGVTYYVRLWLEDGDGNWSSFSNQASTVSAPSPSNSIVGHVVNASTQGITAVQIDCWNSAGALVNTTFTVADGSGTYAVNGLVGGNYKIQASWTANGITSSVWQDAIPMGSYGVDFSLEINYALATLTGTLGTLGTAGTGSYGAAGVGALGSNYFTASHIELYQGGRQVGQVGVSENGRWTIAGLLPGTYQVRAFTAGGYTDFVTVELIEGEIHVVGFVFDPLPESSVYNFPNPARRSTTIRFESSLFPLESQVMIFDLAGNLVRDIPGSQITSPSAGRYHASWDLTNMRGENVASGVYLMMVKVRGGSDNQNAKVTKKIAVVR